MKPPQRTRKTPKRIQDAEEPLCPGNDACQWPRGEQNQLLAALKSLHKAVEPHQDVDYSVLEARLPSRSPEEIRCAVELLKKQVISSTAARLQKNTQQEQRAAKPIEEWTQLAARVTGSHEEVVSAALSQVLVVSSTEPCTLRNSDPPLHCGPVGLRPAASARRHGTGGTASVITAVGAPAAAASPPLAATHQAGAAEASGMKDVNFERIYCFLNTVLRSSSSSFQLTPMESAIVLDLLMSLPEELPLLDCNKLHRHFTQVFRCFSAPADCKKAKQMFGELKENVSSPAETRTAPNPQGSAPPSSGSQSEDSLHVPPLNPFMVPLKLLQRREQESTG